MNKKILLGLMALALTASCAQLGLHKKCCPKSGEICKKEESSQATAKEMKSEKKAKKSRKSKAEKVEVQTEEKKN